MKPEVWQFLGVLLSVLVAYLISVRANRRGQPADRSASAAEVTAIGARLDVATARIDRLERVVRGFRQHVAEDEAEHRANGWPIRPLPEDLA